MVMREGTKTRKEMRKRIVFKSPVRSGLRLSEIAKKPDWTAKNRGLRSFAVF